MANSKQMNKQHRKKRDRNDLLSLEDYTKRVELPNAPIQVQHKEGGMKDDNLEMNNKISNEHSLNSSRLPCRGFTL